MGWIESEPFRVTGPYAADVFVWRETLEGLEATGEVVGRDEVVEMTAQLVMAVVVEAFDGRLLDGSVHPLDLSIRPRRHRRIWPRIQGPAWASAKGAANGA